MRELSNFYLDESCYDVSFTRAEFMVTRIRVVWHTLPHAETSTPCSSVFDTFYYLQTYMVHWLHFG